MSLVSIAAFLRFAFHRRAKVENFIASFDVFHFPDVDLLKDFGTLNVLNMNDAFGWALAWSEPVPDADLPELARLLKTYGVQGAYYYTSEHNDKMATEFEHIQRGINFVRQEEAVLKQFPDPSKRAYHKL